MKERYLKHWSRQLDREMEYAVFEADQPSPEAVPGKVCLAFPPQNEMEEKQ